MMNRCEFISKLSKLPDWCAFNKWVQFQVLVALPTSDRARLIKNFQTNAKQVDFNEIEGFERFVKPATERRAADRFTQLARRLPHARVITNGGTKRHFHNCISAIEARLRTKRRFRRLCRSSDRHVPRRHVPQAPHVALRSRPADRYPPPPLLKTMAFYYTLKKVKLT